MDHWITLIRSKLETWLTGFIKLLPNLTLAILIFVVFFLFSKYVRRVVNRFLLKVSGKPAISGLFSTIIYIIFLFAGLFISLELLHLEKTISSLLAGAGIIGLALGFAFQDLTANFISGVFIIFRKPFEVGQIVDSNGFIGTVEEIKLRSTTIRTYQGLHIMLPNKDIFQKPITNYSLSGDRRIDISLVLPVKTNTGQLEQTLKKALSDIPGIKKEKPPEIYFTDYTGDTIKIEIWCWIDNKTPMGFTDTKDKIIKKVHDALNPAG
ncbi:MAG TPA: mechanosensitive ion channel [Puia sp.]|jgi:small-conductance mechanosensitive channel